MTDNRDIEQRLARLEERTRAVEDELEITRLILSYGPLVDSGSAEAVAGLWERDGVYDVDELVMTGQDEIAAMVGSDRHQGWIAGGCAHFIGAPHVTVNGDEAVAVCYSLMVLNGAAREGGPGDFRVRRATANHWRLRRGPDGWRVTARTGRVLDGRTESPELLMSGIPTE
ncbi:nuclear transport factor 2 family protein [Sphaerimonospora cavernae]|uniref:Nuclear transport factor 2 family protein n=1 Tax=Sphaerimonospora cavernae TaxID=1740611 RepID=A0ABV6U0Y8_9ACTN